MRSPLSIDSRGVRQTTYDFLPPSTSVEVDGGRTDGGRHGARPLARGRCKIGRGGCSSTDADWHGDGERAANEPDMTMLNAEKKGRKTDCELERRGGGGGQDRPLARAH